MTEFSGKSLTIALIGYMHGRGGIQTHTRFLTEGLRERGHSVHVFSPSPMAEHGHTDETTGIHVYSSLRDLVLGIRAVRPDVAVVVGTGWKAMWGALAAGKSCRKVFFEVMSGARSKFADPRMLSRFGFDAIVGQGSAVTERFIREFSWHGQSETIPALPEPLERQFSIPRRSLPDEIGSVRFAYFGRLAPPKNVRLLVERFEDYAPRGSTLDIWGDGSDANVLAQLTHAAGLGERVRLRGRYPDGQVYVELLQNYDLLLLPTVAEEGAPLVLLEAMACGLPFVANGMGGIPDYANPDSLITDGEIEAFIPSVQSMVKRLQIGDVNAARLQDLYRENFSFVRLVNRWEAFLGSLL